MNALSVAKYALNSQIGTDGLQPLDKLIEQLSEKFDAAMNRKTVLKNIYVDSIEAYTDLEIFSGRGELKELLVSSDQNYVEVYTDLYVDGSAFQENMLTDYPSSDYSYLTFSAWDGGFGFIESIEESSSSGVLAERNYPGIYMPGICFTSNLSIQLHQPRNDSFSDISVVAVIDTY